MGALDRRTTRILDRALANSASLSLAELERLLGVFGFVLKRQKASHRQWVHPLGRRPISLQRLRGGKAKAYQVDEVLAEIERLGLYAGAEEQR